MFSLSNFSLSSRSLRAERKLTIKLRLEMSSPLGGRLSFFEKLRNTAALPFTKTGTVKTNSGLAGPSSPMIFPSGKTSTRYSDGFNSSLVFEANARHSLVSKFKETKKHRFETSCFELIPKYRTASEKPFFREYSNRLAKNPEFLLVCPFSMTRSILPHKIKLSSYPIVSL